jgi:hypothetical protein
VWWQDNNLSFNVIKTKEMIVDYKKQRAKHAHIHINRVVVEQVESFKFLCVYITKVLSRSTHTNTVMKRVRQCLFPLRKLKRFGMGPQILKKLYSCTIESILLAASPLGMTTAWHPTTRRYREEGIAYGPVHHWGQAPCHPGHLYQAVSEEGPKNCQRLSDTIRQLLPPRHKTAK